MLKNVRIYSWVIIAMIVFVSCEKTLNLEVESRPPVVVVDAWIEEGKPPMVILSNSLDYFSQMDIAALFKVFIRGAKITINDGSQTYPVNEYWANSSAPYYSTDTNTVTPHVLVGTQGKKYTLTIETGGKTYQAVTIVPVHAKTVDSIWWKPLPKISDTPNVSVMVRITDPPGLGNYIRYFVKINQRPEFPPDFSAFDDQVVDGKTYDVQLSEVVDWNNRDTAWSYSRGDTVTIKFCNIDKATHEFWRTWENNMRSIGNPFASPGKVIGNISNGALGAFCGYSVQRKTVIIPK